MRDIGKNIRLLRIKQNITQDELAEKLFVSRQTVSNYETGRSRPDVDTLIRLSEILNVEVQDLLYGPPVTQSQIIERRWLLFGLSLLAAMTIVCIGTEHLIEYLRDAPDELYLSYFVSGAFYALSLIIRPCLFLVLGWTFPQALSLLPKGRIPRYDAKCVRKIVVALIILYFLVVGIFCGWMIITNWQAYQFAFSESTTEAFHKSFSLPVVTSLVRFFTNHHNSLWMIFVPLGMLLWLSAGRTPEARHSKNSET